MLYLVCMNLDSLPDITKLDTKNTLSSISHLADQMEQAWNEVMELTLPDDFAQAKNIVLSGMGGSALGGRMIHSLFAGELRAPFEVVTGYHLPHYVNEETLVIVSSYSGTTEETVAALSEAKERGAKIFVLTTGGELQAQATKNSLCTYNFTPTHNASGQPRLALGYSATAVIALLTKLAFLSVPEESFKETITAVRKLSQMYGVTSPESSNAAKHLARKMKNQIPVYLAAEHLVGVAHAVKNQTNETGKHFAALFDLPELNHHLLEGLKFPAVSHEQLLFILFDSHLYSPRVQKRVKVTEEVIGKNNCTSVIYTLSSENKLTQVFELLTLGSFATFYLAMLAAVDPSQIPWVDYFKDQMGH